VGFEPQAFRASKHLGNADWRCPELMANLLSFDTDPVKA
jgi:hypothetical protein